MTLKKAVEILSNSSPRLKRCAPATFIEASRLGKEALKRVRDIRTGYNSYALDLLPGETKE